MLFCDIEVSEFGLESRYFDHFWTITEPSYPQNYELNRITTVILQAWMWKIDMQLNKEQNSFQKCLKKI